MYNIPYIVLSGDIKSSKNLIIRTRNALQQTFSAALKRINEKYSEDISSQFSISMGDSFQGLLCTGRNIMHILWEIEQHLYPIKIRFGIGIGSVTTSINPQRSEENDGSAYHKAREAIDYLKDIETKKQIDIPDTRILIDSSDKALEQLLNTIFLLTTAIKERWTARQRQIIDNILTYNDGQIHVAQRLQITQPSVNKGLIAGKYYTIKESFDTIEHFLSNISHADV